MILPEAELELSRTHPQSTDLYLSIFQPQVVMDAIPSGTLSIGSMNIPYTVTDGDYLYVSPGMTLLVGTSPEGRELGKIRIRSITADEIIVAENSHIDWSLATNLTVLNYYEVWPVYPRVIPDPADDENVIFYKDYDIEYTNQNTILGTFICAGSHRAGYAGDSFYFTATGTFHLVSGTALTYDWELNGAGNFGQEVSSDETPGWYQFPTAGHYVIRLTVTGDNGSSDTTYRYVSIYDRPETLTNSVPIKNWEIDTVSGSREEGGYSGNVRIINEIPPDLHDGDVVVIWSNDWYGGTNQSIGGNADNGSKIFFSGHIVNGSIRYSYSISYVEFQISSITDIMKQCEGFAISIENNLTPTKWFQLLELDARRALYHYLKWHTTVLSVADFQFIGTDQNTHYFDSDRESIFDAIDNYMRLALIGDVCADRQGKIWAEVGAVVYSNPTGSFPPIQEITKRDWLGEPRIEEVLTPPMSFVECGGVQFSGVTTGTFSAFLSQAPGTVPSTRGTVENIQGLTIAGQDHLNEISGNVYANRNAKYPSIELDMAGNFRQFDIAPQETVDINIAMDDTNRGIALHAPYLLNGITWQYNSRDKLMLPSVSLKALVNGRPGVAVSIPEIPDGGGYSDFGGGFNFNPGDIPPFLFDVTNKAIGKWTGSFQADATLDVGFEVTGTVFNYGYTFSIAEGAPVAPIAGVYAVSAMMKLANGAGGETIQIFVQGYSAFAADYAIPISFADTDTYVFSNSYYYNAGDPIKFFISNGDTTGQGVFEMSVHLLYSL